MATITTSTQAQGLSYPSESYLDRNPNGGNLWQIVRTSAGALQLFYSTNGGGSWIADASFTRSNLVEWSGLFIDTDGWIHIAYRVYESGRDVVYYRRNGTSGWSSEVQISSGVAASSGDTYQGLSLVAMIFGNHTDIFVAVGTTSGANIGVTLFSLSVKWVNDWYSGGYWWYQVVNLIQGTRAWFMTGSGHVSPSLDFRHNGDGHSSNVPELWIAFGRSTINVVKVAYSNGRWIGPTTSTTLAIATTAQNHVPGRFDGSRFLVPVLNADKVSVYERDLSNTVTNVRTSPVHTTGVVRHATINYVSTTGDFRVYAVGTSTAVLYYVDYVRATNTWGAWVSTAKTIVNVNNFGVRRGSYGNARYDYYAQTGSSPYTIEHNAQTLAFAPNTPTLVSPLNGVAADVASPLVFDWDFTDIDPADTQAGYALSRQIGAGALAYWRASDSTWQAGEVNNASSTTAVTLPVGWGADSDANHTYRVKVWDSSGLASGYSSSVVIVPSARVIPTVTYPVASETLAIQDTFTRALGELSGSTPNLSSGNWVGTVGRWRTNVTLAEWVTGNNTLRVPGSSGNAKLTLDDLIIDTTSTGVARTWIFSVSADSGVINMVSIRIRVSSSGVNTVDLLVFQAGVGTVIGSAVVGGLPVQVGYTADVTVKVEGTLVVGTVGPVTILSTLSTAQKASVASGTYAAINSDAAASIAELTVHNLGTLQVTASDITLTWSVASQRAFQIKLYELATGFKVYDSGLVTSQTGSFRLPYTLLNNTSYWVELTTTNTEGLSSNVQVVTFDVDFVEPVAPTFSLSELDTLGLIRLSILNPDPTGAEPVASTNTLYRRRVGDTSEGEAIASISASISTNLLANYNYSFENALGTEWVSDNPPVSTIARTLAESHLGVYSIEQTAVSGAGFGGITHIPANSVSAVAGTSYTMTVWVKGTVGRNFQIYLGWLTATETVIGYSSNANVNANGSWQQLSLTVTAPALTAYMLPFVGRSNTANSIGEKSWVDDVRLGVTGAVAQPILYDDFTVASDIDYGYRVLTTAVNGTSIYTSWVN